MKQQKIKSDCILNRTRITELFHDLKSREPSDRGQAKKSNEIDRENLNGSLIKEQNK